MKNLSCELFPTYQLFGLIEVGTSRVIATFTSQPNFPFSPILKIIVFMLISAILRFWHWLRNCGHDLLQSHPFHSLFLICRNSFFINRELVLLKFISHLLIGLCPSQLLRLGDFFRKPVKEEHIPISFHRIIIRQEDVFSFENIKLYSGKIFCSNWIAIIKSLRTNIREN